MSESQDEQRQDFIGSSKTTVHNSGQLTAALSFRVSMRCQLTGIKGALTIIIVAARCRRKQKKKRIAHFVACVEHVFNILLILLILSVASLK